jgi:hypothetical protein
MGMERIDVNGVPCWYKKLEADRFVQVRQRLGHEDRCPLCGTELVRTGHLYLFLTNQKLFPNVICHAGCVESKEMTEAVRELKTSYEEARRKMDEASAWFPWI